MNKFCTALLAFLMLLALSMPAWAQGKSSGKLPCLTKNDTHYGHHYFKADRHKMRVLKQFRELKKAYEKSSQDVKQMFLEFLGSATSTADTDIQKIREEYEQQIAQLNETIASNQQQLAAMEATYQQQLTDMQAAYQQQLADAGASCQTQLAALNDSHEQQVGALVAAHAAALEEMSDTCTLKIDAAFKDGQADGLETCANTTPAGEPQPTATWSTGNLSPYALDVDAAGNTYVLDQDYLTVGVYDNAGTSISQWAANTLSMPVDLAVDSQNNVYVLDEYAAEPLQKFNSSGQPEAFGQGDSPIFFPLGLFIDSQDNIYVSDLGGDNGHRILVFDPSGNLIRTLGDVDDATLAYEEYRDIAVDEQNQTVYVVTGNYVAKFDIAGTLTGSWPGSLRSPNSIAVGGQGQIFVADTYNNEIDQYDADGNLMYSFSSDGALYRPMRIVVDDAGRLNLADKRNQLVRVYQ